MRVRRSSSAAVGDAREVVAARGEEANDVGFVEALAVARAIEEDARAYPRRYGEFSARHSATGIGVAGPSAPRVLAAERRGVDQGDQTGGQGG